MTNDQIRNLVPWFALKSVPGIGNHLFKRLSERLGSPEAVFRVSEKELLEVEGITPRLAAAILNHKLPDLVKAELDLISDTDCQIVTLADPEYPPLLREIPDPPPFLYVRGDLGNSVRSIAVVGSRSATRYGISAATRLSSDLASLKITVVSGMARGIDTAAHDGAIMGRGKTIAVLGSGLERIYPAENLKLSHAIAENGAVVSEFHLTAGPDPHHFPIRNRIISGISLGTVVVEAPPKSGALITARFALEQGREVFAIPGNIYSFKSRGPHNLIKEGAKLVASVQDIVEEMPRAIKDRIGGVSQTAQNEILTRLPPLTPEESAVVQALGPYPVHIDDLGRKISMDASKLSGILLQLELKGVVHQEPGMLFSIDIKEMF